MTYNWYDFLQQILGIRGCFCLAYNLDAKINPPVQQPSGTKQL